MPYKSIQERKKSQVVVGNSLYFTSTTKCKKINNITSFEQLCSCVVQKLENAIHWVNHYSVRVTEFFWVGRFSHPLTTFWLFWDSNQ